VIARGCFHIPAAPFPHLIMLLIKRKTREIDLISSYAYTADAGYILKMDLARHVYEYCIRRSAPQVGTHMHRDALQKKKNMDTTHWFCQIGTSSAHLVCDGRFDSYLTVVRRFQAS
jgi:hypothetical protein